MRRYLPYGKTTLVELLRWRAEHQASQQAYTFLLDGETDEVQLTYGELDRQARIIGAQLQTMGASAERVLLLYPPGLAYLTAFFGCLYAGAVAVPLYPPPLNRSNPRLEAILNNSQAKIALTEATIWSNLERRLVHTPAVAALQWLVTDNLTADLADLWYHPAIGKDTLAFLQYTSGSTATPKGVMVNHHNLLYNAHMVKLAFGHSEKTIFVGWSPLYHDMGLIGNILQPLYLGVPCILMPPVAFLQQPIRWLQAISRYRATTSGGPNFAYEHCIRKIKPHQRLGLDLSSWEVAFIGAEPVRAETLDRFAATFEPCGFRREALYPGYGLAEATLFVSGRVRSKPTVIRQADGEALEQNRVIMPAGEVDKTQAIVGCGQSWLDQKIIIVDPKSLIRCPPDQVGEIWISGANIAQGYWDRPEETAETFQAYLADTGDGPFLRTGDLGFLAEQELFITGRLKDIIIIRGRNHYPQDIELTVAHSHPALQPDSGAAFAVDVEGEAHLVVAQEVSRPHLRHLDRAEVIGAIRQAVSEQHELQIYAVLLLKPGGIPKTTSGKVQRHACRAGFLEESLTIWASEIRAPVSQTVETPAAFGETTGNSLLDTLLTVASPERERLLTAQLQVLVAGVLGTATDRVSPEQSLPNLGLDSVIAVELSNRIQQNLGLTVPATKFLSDLSLAELAAELSPELTEMSAGQQAEESRSPDPTTQQIDPSVPNQAPSAKAILANLDQLTDQEVDNLLASRLLSEE